MFSELMASQDAGTGGPMVQLVVAIISSDQERILARFLRDNMYHQQNLYKTKIADNKNLTSK